MSVSRSLLPREHGAYVQLLAPLATALVARTPTWQAALLAIAAACAFLANEPLLVMLGHRGKRIRSSDGARAQRRLLGLGLVAIATGTIGLAASSLHVLAVAALVAAPGAITIVLAWRRAEKSLA